MLLIDGDIVRYQASASCEKNYYIVEGVEFDTWKAATAYAEQIGNPPIERGVHYEEEWKAKANVNHIIDAIKEHTNGRPDGACRIYLSGNSNYRNAIATVRPYKGNRDRRKRPIYLDVCTDYLLRKYDVEICEGQEADDGMGIAQTDETCICTIDKDLDLVTGWHYNWSTDELYFIHQDEADYKFAHQLLTGDKTDNIVGIPNCGTSRADSILVGASLRHELAERVQRAYAKAGVLPTLQEMGQLLWIRRKPNQMWNLEDWANGSI